MFHFCAAATHPFGARVRAPPAHAGPPALARPWAPAPALARPLAAATTQLWNSSTTGSWYYGAALTAGAALVTSYGDPYHAPYAWSVATFGPLNTSAPGPAPRADFTFPSVPGSVWGSRGGAPLALFSGMSFTDEAAVVAAFSPGVPAPLFEETLPGVSGNWWQTGANVGASVNGSIVGYAFTGLARYDPLGPKRAQVLALDLAAVPARELLYDALPNGTGLEGLRLSADGSTLVAWAAIDPAGQINSSLVRVYDVRRGALVAQWVSPYVLAGCLSPSGASLVLATCDSENSIEAFRIDLAGGGSVAQTVNSTYPSFAPSQPTFTYAAFCEATDAGALWVAFPLWWGGAINQTAVAFYGALPSAPSPAPYLAPSALWLSPPISAALQDDLMASAAAIDPATGESFFVFVGWGGAPAAGGGPCPPTLRVFRSSAPGAPAAEVATPSAGDASVSGSLESVDAALLAGGQLLVVAGGLDGHANDGSTGGRLLAWSVAV
jgi:hypothetical protein